MRVSEYLETFLNQPDGTYLITPKGVVNYAERWGYGYIVAVRPLEVDDLTEYTLAGIWTNDGVRHYDLVKHVGAYQDAVREAHENEQTSMYDLLNGEVVYI